MVEVTSVVEETGAGVEVLLTLVLVLLGTMLLLLLLEEPPSPGMGWPGPATEVVKLPLSIYTPDQ